MATRTATIKQRTTASGAKDVIVQWTGLLNGDDGQWISIPGMVLRSISQNGTWGTGGSVSIRGSNGDAMMEKPTDVVITGTQPDETQIAGPFSSNGLTTANLYIATASYRPLVTAGDGTTSLTLTMYFVQD